MARRQRSLSAEPILFQTGHSNPQDRMGMMSPQRARTALCRVGVALQLLSSIAAEAVNCGNCRHTDHLVRTAAIIHLVISGKSSPGSLGIPPRREVAKCAGRMLASAGADATTG